MFFVFFVMVVGRISWFDRFLVARGLRILPDFAGFCQAKSFIFFVCNGCCRTHNLLVPGSNPGGPTTREGLFFELLRALSVRSTSVSENPKAVIRETCLLSHPNPGPRPWVEMDPSCGKQAVSWFAPPPVSGCLVLTHAHSFFAYSAAPVMAPSRRFRRNCCLRRRSHHTVRWWRLADRRLRLRREGPRRWPVRGNSERWFQSRAARRA